MSREMAVRGGGPGTGVVSAAGRGGTGEGRHLPVHLAIVRPARVQPYAHRRNVASHAVSNTGVVIGTYWTGTTPANANAFGYELQNGVYTTFTAPGSATGFFSGTYGQGVNNSGLAIFIFQANGAGGTISSTSYLYQPLLGTYLPIIDPNAAVGPLNTFANSINDAGIVTGVYYDASGNGHGFQYNVATGNYITLPDVPAAFSTTAVSQRRETVTSWPITMTPTAIFTALLLQRQLHAARLPRRHGHLYRRHQCLRSNQRQLR